MYVPTWLFGLGRTLGFFEHCRPLAGLAGFAGLSCGHFLWWRVNQEGYSNDCPQY
jgi:hypothetical protein